MTKQQIQKGLLAIIFSFSLICLGYSLSKIKYGEQISHKKEREVIVNKYEYIPNPLNEKETKQLLKKVADRSCLAGMVITEIFGVCLLGLTFLKGKMSSYKQPTEVKVHFYADILLSLITVAVLTCSIPYFSFMYYSSERVKKPLNEETHKNGFLTIMNLNIGVIKISANCAFTGFLLTLLFNLPLLFLYKLKYGYIIPIICIIVCYWRLSRSSLDFVDDYLIPSQKIKRNISVKEGVMSIFGRSYDYVKKGLL